MNMSPQEYQRKLEDSGYPGDEVHDMVRAYSRQESLAALQAMGYSEDDLEASNPYN